MTINVLRRKNAAEKPYWESWFYEPRDRSETVASTLTRLNEALKDPIRWECSCLQCGCCLEVCPNFLAGGLFTGMAGGVPMARLLAELPQKQREEAARLYRELVFEGCGKSLACRNVCPAGLDIDELLVNSNTAAVWKRFFGGKHDTKNQRI